MSRPKRVLFFAEAVTLAHVARPIALAQRLDGSAYECTIACDMRYQRFLQDGPWTHAPLRSIESERFLRALAKGRPVYDLDTLRGYVRQDLELIERFEPDLVVGDFRLSLSVSARLARVPYVTISNAYWSPYYARPDFPMPVLPMTSVLPLRVAAAMFRLASPMAMRSHCAPLNHLRAENGLPSLGTNLRRIYTDADLTLYADAPELFELRNTPANHRLVSPLLWEPNLPQLAWWHELRGDRPIVYVTLGSSGPKRALARVLDALASLPLQVIASSAGETLEPTRWPNAFIAPYLPGLAAAARSAVVICNGGSLTAYQALMSGVPVLGIANNMDQFMNMQALEAAGVGRIFRGDRLDGEQLRAAVVAAINGQIIGARAQGLKLAECCASSLFSALNL